MSLEISTAGITLGYAVADAGTVIPASSTVFTNIPNIKSIPDFNSQPETIEVTDLSDTEYKRYIPALKDVSGALAFTANFTKEFAKTWNTLVGAYTTAIQSNKVVWFKISVPEFSDFYFIGIPSELGLPESAVGEVFDGEVYITPNQVIGWDQTKFN